MNRLLKPSRLLLLLLALMLIVSAPAALADSGVRAVVSVEAMNVYASKSPHALLGSLPRGTEVTVTARSGDAVMIRYGGKTGVARISDLSRAEADSAEQTAQVEEGREMTVNRDTRIYSKASTSSRNVSVKAGTTVTLLAVNGACARVRLDGKVGYMVHDHLSEPGSAPQDAGSTQAEAVTTVNAPAVTTQSARVYASAERSGDYISVSKGVSLTLLAVRGDCAMVEKDGAIGYMSASSLGKAGAQDSAKAAETKADSNPFASGSNERTIYSFLTGEMGYNRAAAMGVMANIKYESSYNPACSGDGGTSYGICQWHAGRKTNLISYCEDNGLDYTSLEGQLKFLKYELSTRYPSVHSYMKQVENTADGAYDAGYYFCFSFEAPAARTSQSTKRGNYAKDTLWGK